MIQKELKLLISEQQLIKIKDHNSSHSIKFYLHIDVDHKKFIQPMRDYLLSSSHSAIPKYHFYLISVEIITD